MAEAIAGLSNEGTFQPFDRLLKAREVAQVMGVSESRAYHLMSSGVLPVIRIGKAVRVSQNELDKWIQEQSRAA